jgi:HPt (histidine-containing phosphotransfer) domain-containing protein
VESEVDDAVLRHLASLIGGPDTLEVIGVYIDDAPGRLADFRRGLEQGDLALAQRAVHTLKSTAASLGATRFAGYCNEVEAVARGGDIAALRALLPVLEARLASVVAELGGAGQRIATSPRATPTRAAPRPSS